MYREYKENPDLITTNYKEILTEAEMADQPDWEALGVPAPKDAIDYKWQEVTFRKSSVHSITEDIDGEGLAMVTLGSEMIILDMTVDEALLKIFGIKLA